MEVKHKELREAIKLAIDKATTRNLYEKLDILTDEIMSLVRKWLRQHWVDYDTTKKPDWVRATIAGTQEEIESILGSEIEIKAKG